MPQEQVWQVWKPSLYLPRVWLLMNHILLSGQFEIFFNHPPSRNLSAFTDEKNLFLLQREGEHRLGENPTTLPLWSPDASQILDTQDKESPEPGALLHVSYTPSGKRKQIPCLLLWILPQLPACRLPTGLWSGQPGKYQLLLDFHLPVQHWKAPSQIFGQQANLEKIAKFGSPFWNPVEYQAWSKK